MTQKITVETKEELKYCEALENGNILFFPSGSFSPDFFSSYAKEWKQETSVSLPQESSPFVNLDVSPTRPMHGVRVLRFFINNSKETLHWTTSAGFADLVKEYAEKISIPASAGYDLKSRLERKMKLLLKSTGAKIPLRSPYDDFMLRMHKFLKENGKFQKNGPKDHWEFPPGSAWAVFTDQLTHTQLPGVLTLTFLVPQTALICPEKSPVSILEGMSGRNLVDAQFLKEAFASR